MNSDLARQLGLYVGVTGLVLLYVAMTTSAGQAGGAANAAEAMPAQALAKRLGMAAAAVAIWMAVDHLLVRFWRSDWMIVFLVRVLIGWGALLSLGAMLSAGHQRALAAAIVFAVTAAFVGLWIGALAKRRFSTG